MKNKILLACLACLVFNFATAQNFSITFAPGDILNSSGTVVDHTVQDNEGINIFFAQTPSFTNVFDSATSPDPSSFASYGDFSWTMMQQTTSGSVEFWTTPGWNGSSGDRITGNPGNTVVVAMTTATSVAATAVGDDVAFLSFAPLPDIADVSLTLNNFDIRAGVEGSIQMVQAVPEPSAFALLAGCFGLAWVMVRRRV